MIKKLIDWLKKIGKPNLVYHELLLGNTDVVGQLPKLIADIEPGMQLEIYTGNSASGPNTWATAIIAVAIGKRVYRTKYDSGHYNGEKDLTDMLSECLFNIKVGWDTKMWKDEAEKVLN